MPKKPKDVRLAPNPYNESSHPGRVITPWSEYLRSGEPGWTGPNYKQRERVVPREDYVDEQRVAAREWLGHVQAERIGPNAGK
jgi:hypothetical protein